MNLENGPRSRRRLEERLDALKAKLQLLEKKKVLKERKREAYFTSMMKIRRTLIKAVEAFEKDKDRVPLEVLSLSKRLIYAINQAENEMVEKQEEEEPFGGGEMAAP